MNDKREIRHRALALRDSVSPECRRMAASCILTAIESHRWYIEAANVLIYASFGSELGTDGIVSCALADGKRVYVPKVEGRGLMNFYRIDGHEELASGYRGIPEPAAFRDRLYVYDASAPGGTLMIMPGVAYDDAGYRLGYGGGFYDRFLDSKTEICTIAIGYECQRVERLPVEEHDYRPMEIILV